MKGILKRLSQHPVLLFFIAYSTAISLLAQNVMGVVSSVAMFLFAIFFYYYQSQLTPKFFRLTIEGILALSVFAAAFAMPSIAKAVDDFAADWSAIHNQEYI